MPYLRLFNEESVSPDAYPRAILLSSYGSGATEGNRLGTAGYSYDFVAKLFAPLLRRFGPVAEIRHPRTELPTAARRSRRQGLEPLHISFRPFQDACLAPGMENVVVPAWEFPDVPSDAFDGNPQNNWVETANRCSLVLASGPFTAKALESAGVAAPVRIVPVPTPEPYYQVPSWSAGERAELDCSAYVFPQVRGRSPHRERLARQRLSESFRIQGRRAYRRLVKPCLPSGFGPVIAAALREGAAAWRTQTLPYRRIRGVQLTGVVYTSIFNPDDGRKNWEDTITAFLDALRDCEDATLVLKLIAANQAAVNRVLAFYDRLDVSHRCRLVLLPDFLSDAEMLELARVTTFYLTSTRAEGNCLPLMNYLAAGRPGISPLHTAIADYFDAEAGFLVESHPEPCAWPQDSRLRWRTSWHRLVWPSLVEQIRRSYHVAKSDAAAYRSMAQAAAERMRRWAHPESVWPQLRSAIELVSPRSVEMTTVQGRTAEPRVIKMPAARLRQTPGIAAIERRNQLAGLPMRVVVSLLSFRPGKIGGTETYLAKLVSRLPHVNRRDEIVLLMDRDLAAENAFPGMNRVVVDMSAAQIMRARGLEAVTPYRARAVEQVIERLQPDVMFFPQQSIFPKTIHCPSVLVVHDLYHLFLPQYLSPGQRLFRERNYAYSIGRADKIVAISQFTKKTIVAQYGLRSDQIDVVPHGWEPLPNDSTAAQQQDSGRYVYYPAITRPHKNHHVLLESIAKLRSRGSFDYRLVLSGIQTPHWKNLRKLIDKLGLNQSVQHVGYVSYERVQQLYRGAECVVFPTSFEGFGLPVVEACEASKKILVSRLEVFGEIGVPERFQIDFADPEQLLRGLEEPGATVLQHRPCTWEESAAATMDVLAAAVGRQSTVRVLARAA